MAKSKFWNGSAWEVLGTDADKITETTDHKVMTAAERTKLSGIAAGAEVNVPTNIAQGTRTTTTVPITSSTGTGATLSAATTSLAGVMTSADKTKLDGIATGANNYSHPATHAPSIITQDANNRFVTDAEKTAWNGKSNFKNGSGTFPAGTTHTVTDAFITVNTLVIISPTAEKQGVWAVNSAAGSFTITSDRAEPTAVTFDWGAVK